jgi:hypothetical protein
MQAAERDNREEKGRRAKMLRGFQYAYLSPCQNF